jgi:hypothetical protein
MAFFSPTVILNHLQKYFPRVTDLFSNNIVVLGEIVTGTPQILRITEATHGLSVGTDVSLINARIDNKITAVQQFIDGDEKVLRFTTENGHDLTLNYSAPIQLSGFTDAGLNNTFNLVDVPNRTTFEIAYDTLPTLTGGEVLREFWEVGINGIFKVARVINPSTYEIDLDNSPTFPLGVLPSLERVGELRMSVAIDAERVRASYTKSPADKLWLYVIMGDSTASKDRNTKTDATQNLTSQNTSRILMINTFSIMVVFPTENQTLGGAAVQMAWETILQYMIAVMAGVQFDDFEEYSSLSTLIDHGSSLYNNAFYAHSYTFEYNYQYTQEETFLTKFIESRAFRNDSISLTESSEDSDIDLDNEPT